MINHPQDRNYARLPTNNVDSSDAFLSPSRLREGRTRERPGRAFFRQIAEVRGKCCALSSPKSLLAQSDSAIESSIRFAEIDVPIFLSTNQSDFDF